MAQKRQIKTNKKLPVGMRMYRFDGVFNGHRKRPKIVCRPGELNQIFAKWLKENSLKYGADGAESFFVNFEGYLENYSKNNKSEKQYKAERVFFENRLKPFLGKDIHVTEFSRLMLADYITWRESNNGRGGQTSRSTVKKDINILSSFFHRWCIPREIVQLNPCSNPDYGERNERDIMISVTQLFELLEKSADSNCYEKNCHLIAKKKRKRPLKDLPKATRLKLFPVETMKHFHTAVVIAVFCGFRRSEILSLKWSDVDFINHTITLRKNNTKTNKTRRIDMNDYLYEYLKVCRSTDTGEIVVPLGADCLRYRFNKLRERLSFNLPDELGDIRFHDMRHLFGEYGSESGIHQRDMQTFLGHESSRSTERYIRHGGSNGREKLTNMCDYILDKYNHETGMV